MTDDTVVVGLKLKVLLETASILEMPYRLAEERIGQTWIEIVLARPRGIRARSQAGRKCHNLGRAIPIGSLDCRPADPPVSATMLIQSTVPIGPRGDLAGSACNDVLHRFGHRHSPTQRCIDTAMNPLILRHQSFPLRAFRSELPIPRRQPQIRRRDDLAGIKRPG